MPTKQPDPVEKIPDPAERIKERYWLDDLATYRKLETWGASLFFAAIGVLTKQLVEWTRFHDPEKSADVPRIWSIAPALVGLAGFIYMRVVNARVRVAQKKVFGLAKIKRLPVGRLGVLGWVLALIPLSAGFAGSFALAQGDLNRMCDVAFVGFLAVLVVILAVIYHFQRVFLLWYFRFTRKHLL